MTIDGTVNVILGYPLFFLITDAKSPAVRAPINAAAAAGMAVKSTSSRRSVLARQPIRAAVPAILSELLNINENPKTPQKLAIMRSTSRSTAFIWIGVKSLGVRLSISAIIHAKTVATRTIMLEYVSLSIPERRSSFARSIPLVINGKPGIINNIEHI